MSDDNHSNHKLYQHKDHTEMQGFLATIKAKAREKTDKNVIKAFQLASHGTPIAPAIDAEALKEANAILHGIIVLNTGNKELLSKLNTDYDDKGDEAIKYIKGCFSAGGNENKEGVARDNYNDLLGKCLNTAGCAYTLHEENLSGTAYTTRLGSVKNPPTRPETSQ